MDTLEVLLGVAETGVGELSETFQRSSPILVRCKVEGVRGFGTLDLDGLGAVSTLVGPNGAGKSTLLRILRSVLHAAAAQTICDEFPETLPNREAWEPFTNAELEFRRRPSPAPNVLREHFNPTYSSCRITVIRRSNIFSITTLSLDDKSLMFTEQQIISRKQRRTAEEGVKQQEVKLAQLQQTLQANQNMKGTYQPQIDQISQQIVHEKQQAIRNSVVVARSADSNKEIKLERETVDTFLAELGLPQPIYVAARTSPETSIPEMIKKLMILKKGRERDVAQFRQHQAQLMHLLQADVDVFDEQNKELLLVNSVPWRQASSGTEITLSFFSLTMLNTMNGIVLWDEPENGLHPTRRCRLLDLMQNDARQYFLATHAPEFISLSNTNNGIPNRVFRCQSLHDVENDKVHLSAIPIADRRDAFSALEALGIHPARTLFTANVVLWIEGPTELIFYRHWRRKRFLKSQTYEGFQYTFMQYGGGVIAWIEANDTTAFNSLFDLLSLCRYPIILLDSDLKAPPNSQHPRDYLKNGASRLLDEIEGLNRERPNSAMLRWTGGREIENYLPPRAIAHALHTLCKTMGDEEKNKLDLESLVVDRYESYDDVLHRHFLKCGIVDKDHPEKPRWRSIWANKPEFMRAALSTPNLEEKELLWDGDKLISSMVRFIEEHS